MPQGQIRKAISGFYYVQTGDGDLVQCKGRGVFRNRGISPLVGDFVTIVEDGDNDATITEVHERKNELVRPPVANVDQALLVFSIVEPDLSLHLLDRFLAVIESVGIKPIICLTKKDIAEESDLQIANSAIDYYKGIGYDVIKTYIDDPNLHDLLYPILKGNTTVLAGQSGVGKSTLLNTLIPELLLKTGEISEALGRGRHTTRHVELMEVAGGLVADTPGFSSLDFDHIEKDELRDYFVEMEQAAQLCKFRGCLHLKEPKCAVKAKVETGEILSTRYDNYVQFMQEIIDRKPRYPKND
ncbi:ribosome small subunit-dependent GTPase A [Sporosarcina highlanderae]|uniref:Small ribosomal subunit biogenesis GTPase RsgA n=1 Tax=Sporosarcina highlanderae TaxID=3035916 RepID=A0ABT8JTL0_9BACL|nr:ribosome small subunit-dependent GTPase A [Sporosarcina highlanderae]MDN4607514.1 ribosome small subunit-dependent GTPase A [Sporosarcina highlanderae]